MVERIIARWVEAADYDTHAYELRDDRGRSYATAWTHGTWHTWDSRGAGGENAHEQSFSLAKERAVAALDRQHRDPHRGWARWRHWLRVSVRDKAPQADAERGRGE